MTRILLVILDGAGDRQQSELGGLTPLAAANTPNLDELATAGVTGLMWPLSPGSAPTSPLAHFVLFGYEPAEFPGRGLVEALGQGVRPGPEAVVSIVNFTRTLDREGSLWIAERPDPRAGEPVNADVDLDCSIGGVRCTFKHTGGAQGVLTLASTPGVALSHHVSDADPLRAETFARAILPFAEAPDRGAAARTAAVLSAWVRESRRRLAGRHLDTALVKWTASASEPPSFGDRTGLRGITLARGALYRGLAAAVGMDVGEAQESSDPATDFASDLSAGIDRLDSGTDFVHVHTKWPDDAGHAKTPHRKRDVLEALDAGFGPHLERLCRGDIVTCVTADHQTPSSGPLYHSGGAVALLMCGAAAGRDDVVTFNEEACLRGSLGHVRGRDLMPLLLDAAERSTFMGAERYSAERCLGTRSEDAVIRFPSEGGAL